MPSSPDVFFFFPVFCYWILCFFSQSKAGPVLIAVNPFKDVPIYGNEVLTAYKQKAMQSPHVYAIADNAYDEMMRGE